MLSTVFIAPVCLACYLIVGFGIGGCKDGGVNADNDDDNGGGGDGSVGNGEFLNTMKRFRSGKKMKL